MSIRMKKASIVAIAAVAALSMGLSSYAQQAPGGAPGGGGFRQGGRQGGGRGFGAPTLATVPAAVLADGLKLSAVQKAKIQAIQDQSRKDMQALRPAPGAQVDRQEMMQKFQALNEETNKSIEGVLTPDQLKASAAFLKSVGAYRTVGIPLEVLPELKLTADQKAKIAAIADVAQKQLQDEMQKLRAAGGNGGGGGGGFQAIQELMKANGDKAAAVLTPAQKSTLDKYKAEHPQQRGGFGGPGGGGGGRRQGAPGGGNGPAF
jgi:hypothetical protein